MTIEDFKNLNDNQKNELIFDADKIVEKVDNEANYQLFKVSNFYIETKISLNGLFKRTFTTYTLKDLPADYAGEVISIPIVSSLKTGNRQAEDDKPIKKINGLFH